MIKTSDRHKSKDLNNKKNNEIKQNGNAMKFINEEDNKIIEEMIEENLHKNIKDSQLVKAAIPDFSVEHPSVREVLETTEKHTKSNDNKKSSKIVALLRFMRKKQRGNSIDTHYGIWKKPQCLDVVYQTSLGLQDIDMMWVHISKENVEYNKHYAGVE